MTTFAAFLFLVALQGWMLQTAVAVTGEAAPRYGLALGTASLGALAAVLASTGYSCTAGVVVSLFLSRSLSLGLASFVGWFATAAVYRQRLRLRGGHALLVALLHHAMAYAASGLLWWVVSWTR